ncbi:MAG: hypothetical protein ACUVTM_04465 [Candidatus Bathyarchaeia archaeon]
MGSASSLKIIMVPNLKSSSIKAVRMIQAEAHIERVFLPEPKKLESHIRAYVKGGITYRDFIGRVKDLKLVPEPLNCWLYTFEPILMGLSQVSGQNRSLDIICYRDTADLEMDSRFTSEITLLTYRTNVSGRINVDDWISLISEFALSRRESLSKEARCIVTRAGYSGNMVLSGLGGKELKRMLTRAFDNVQIQCAERIYYFTPMEVLQSKLARGTVNREEVEELVRCHLEYVNRYVLRSWNRDFAYYSWVNDKMPWLRYLLPSSGIGELRVL